ncbi:DUF3261 domain-containing protein [Vibrio sp. CK2-1]|uniref:DUF3261 domain-containing protein n=1 Tax=Vibrio sp. CK2-1 TaxID=2912249 RepID=UPI001F214390|nr:DUF3261 domain-containing protein [Vibrio sp. CK2-1]MCF7353745.1 DUF3261 domain-containing protein [Vibrio sp. CK2-1]
MKILTRFIGWILLVSLTACSTQSTPSNSSEENNRIQIADDTWVALPQPSELGYSLSASQLLSVRYIDQAKKAQSNQLPIQLQITQDKLVLAGFSSWGTRLLSLTYQDNQLDTYVMVGLGNTLPKPEQVVFNLMITLYPLEVWQPRLQQVGWKLTEQQTGNRQSQNIKQRTLFDNHGKLIAEINYASIDPLKGDITFINHALDFTIVIKTLQYQQD